MDRVRDFAEDVQTSRSLQLKTFITVVLGITGFSLFCVENARLHRVNDVTHFNMVWDSKGEKREAKEQQFPVVGVCPSTTDDADAISHLVCTGYGPDSYRAFSPSQKTIKIGQISGQDQDVPCWIVNDDQDFTGHNSSYFLRCDVTFATEADYHTARISHWGNPKVWPHAFVTSPPENTYMWRSVSHAKTQEFYFDVKKFDFKGQDHWWSDIKYGQYFRWNVSDVNPQGPHLSFTLGYAFGMYKEFKEGKEYTTNMMLGTVGGMAFLLSLLNVAAFAFFAGLLQLEDLSSLAPYRQTATVDYGSGKVGGAASAIPASQSAGSYGAI